MKKIKHLNFQISPFLFAALMIPTTDLSSWKIEQFSRLAKNEVTSSAKGILIQVHSSAGPLIYPLKSKTKIVGFKVKGEFQGLPVFLKLSQQGQKGFDDFPFRIGFVIPGEKKLTGLKRIFAADWVKRLYDQVPQGSGLDQVLFYNVTQNSEQVGTSRTHPSSDLIQENFFALAKASGPFDYSIQFKHPIDAVAIWISIDGDDTKSTYATLISDLELQLSY